MKQSSNGQGRFTFGQQADWASRFRSSGMTLRQFAEVHHLKPGRLRYWVYQERKPPVSVSAKAPEKFVEMKVGDFLGGDRWAVEIAWSGGLTVRFREGVAPGWLGAVVAAVRPPC
jgi:hypothetical protein